MRVAKSMKRGYAILMAVIMIFTSLAVFPVKTKAAVQYDLTQYMTSDNLNGTVTISGESTVAEINFVLPDSLNEKSEFEAEGINNMTVVLTVTEYTGSGSGTSGIQPYIESNAADTWYSGGVWQNIAADTQQTLSFNLSSFDWKGGTSVNRLGIQFANLQSGSTLKYTISSITLSGTGSSSGTGSVPSGSQSSLNSSTDIVQATITEVCDNSYWYEYNITVSNTSENSICGWVIKAYLPGVDVSGANTFDTCKLTYADGYLYIEGQGDGSVVAGQSNNSAFNVKFGIGTSIGFDTSDITEITYEYGSEVNSGTNDLVCKYTLTGATKELSAADTPVGKHGKLHVDGIYLYDEHNEKIQLRGASLHGLQWDVGYNYINKNAFQSLRDEWGINAIRLPVYVTQGGYTEGAADAMDTRIQNAVQYATELGMYVLIDWHVHSESGATTNPNTWKEQANSFFTKYASTYKDNNNVLFEICNEPVDTVWYDGNGNDLYSYANSIIQTIRTYTDAVVIVGTNTWSQDVDDVAAHKLDTTNTMYTIHFYSATHMSSIRSKVQTALNSGVPVFCTEFGVCSADGNGSYNLDEADLWMDLFDSYSISYFCWQLSNKNEKSSYLTTSCTKTTGGWTNSDLSVTGIWLVNENRSKADAEAGGSGSDPITPVAVTNVSLNKNTLTLDKGAAETLTATISPSDATNKAVSWSTSNGNVATVDGTGKVTAAGAGQAVITVKTTDGGKTADCTVTVWVTPEAPAATPSVETPASDSITLEYLEGYEYRIKDGAWQDSNVFSGLTPDTQYTFEIRKKADDASYQKAGKAVEVTISTLAAGEVYVPVSGVTLDKTSLSLNMESNQTSTLSATVSPEDATDKTVTYYSSNEAVATVNAAGKVTAAGPGEAVITVKTNLSGKEASCTVKVYQKYAAPSAPALVSVTTNTVTLQSVAGCEYSRDGRTWQTSNVFTGLHEGTTYTFFARRTAGGYYTTSDKSSGTNVTTKTTPAPVTVPAANVTYRTHVQTFGWQAPVSNGIMSGTSGKAKRLEGIEISVNNGSSNLGIQYTTHCQSYGWLPWSANGEMNGTEGEAKRLEAIKIQLTGADKDKYDVYYRVHAQTYGWMNWAVNGEPAGTAGYAKRLEGIQIVVVKKGESFNRNMGNIVSGRSEAYIAKAGASPVVGGPAANALNPVIPGDTATNVAYKTHVQTYGWQGWRYNGAMSGTQGEAKRLEGINIKLTNKQYSGGISYTTHVQTYGWQGDVNNPDTWKKDGELAGTSGEAKRLEAICITLTGEMANHYDVYYRVHAQTYGWLDWAVNGAPAGTAGYAKRLEGIEIVLVEKGGRAPGSTARPYVEK